MTILPDLNRNVQPKDSNLKQNLSDLRDALKPVLLSILNEKAKKHSKSAKSDKIEINLLYCKIKKWVQNIFSLLFFFLQATMQKVKLMACLQQYSIVVNTLKFLIRVLHLFWGGIFSYLHALIRD